MSKYCTRALAFVAMVCRGMHHACGLKGALRIFYLLFAVNLSKSSRRLASRGVGVRLKK
jgi:hypothetical protein